jgi:phage portal protein BeeE
VTSIFAAVKPQLKAFSEPKIWDSDHYLNGAAYVGLYSDMEAIDHDFEAYAQQLVKESGIVFALLAVRQLVFSQAKILWREVQDNGRPGGYFKDDSIDLLRHPWPGGSTAELLSRMEQDASVHGNYYGTVTDDFGRYGKRASGPTRRVIRLRPDRVVVLIDSPSEDPNAADAKVVGYVFDPYISGGRPTGTDKDFGRVFLLPEEMCHYAPHPDPTARFRGMSWLTPVVEEIMADKAATRHKKKFFANGATPNMVIDFEKGTPTEEIKDFAERMRAQHEGSSNAYKTLVLAAGATAKVVGADLRQIDFKATQGAGETRIAADAGVPPSIVGFSEGMQGSSLNAGNYMAARRRFVDGTLHPLWNMAVESWSTLFKPPRLNVELVADTRDIAFLREDKKDAAEIFRIQASGARLLTDAGWLPDDVIEAAVAEDLSLLKGKHSGLSSVQLLAMNPQRDEKDEALVQNTQANTLATLTSTSIFKPDSIVEAVTSGDWSKLVKAPPKPIPKQLPQGGEEVEETPNGHQEPEGINQDS